VIIQFPFPHLQLTAIFIQLLNSIQMRLLEVIIYPQLHYHLFILKLMEFHLEILEAI